MKAGLTSRRCQSAGSVSVLRPAGPAPIGPPSSVPGRGPSQILPGTC